MDATGLVCTYGTYECKKSKLFSKIMWLSLMDRRHTLISDRQYCWISVLVGLKKFFGN